MNFLLSTLMFFVRFLVSLEGNRFPPDCQEEHSKLWRLGDVRQKWSTSCWTCNFWRHNKCPHCWNNPLLPHFGGWETDQVRSTGTKRWNNVQQNGSRRWRLEMDLRQFVPWNLTISPSCYKKSQMLVEYVCWMFWSPEPSARLKQRKRIGTLNWPCSEQNARRLEKGLIYWLFLQPWKSDFLWISSRMFTRILMLLLDKRQMSQNWRHNQVWCYFQAARPYQQEKAQEKQERQELMDSLRPALIVELLVLVMLSNFGIWDWRSLNTC